MQIKYPFKGKFKEFKKGERFIKSFKRGVVIFGSARTKPTTKEYKKATKIAYNISRYNIPIITGGGAGCMEASNKGAKDKISVAMNIKLPFEQCSNPYANKVVLFKHFYIRKYFLMKSSKATIIMPGGLGTLDEAFEALTLIQTGKIKPRPVIFVGKSYYKGLVKWIKKKLLKKGSISEKDTKLFSLTDNIDEIVKKSLKPFRI